MTNVYFVVSNMTIEPNAIGKLQSQESKFECMQCLF